MAEATLQVEQRPGTGKQAAKQMRDKGMVPGVVYGLEDAPEALAMNGRELLDMLNKNGRNVVVNLALGKSGDKIKAFIYEIQHDPITGSISHVDFKRISLKEKIHVSVPVHLDGTPEGVKNEGGIVEHIMHTINISCLPSDIPEAISIDVSGLHLHESIHIGDITTDKYDILDESEQTVVHVVAPKVVVSADEEGEEVEEGAAEPEVIGKSEETEE